MKSRDFLRLTGRLGLIQLLLLFILQTAFADSATWNLNPTSGDWNTATNWTPNTVPNGPSDMATFGVSNTADVFLSASTEVDGITFDPGASAFKIQVGNNLTLTLSGVGIVNNSAIPQNFVAGGDAFSASIQFLNSAAAGNSTRFTVNGPRSMSFYNSSTAGNGIFRFKGTDRGSAGLFFYDSSNAGNGIFTFNPGPQTADCEFFGNSSAGNSLFTSGGGVEFSCFVGFFETSTADRATLVATAGISGGNGGYVGFADDSTGGTARVVLLGSGTTSQSEGTLDVTNHNPPGLSIGSLEGSGLVELGDNSSPILTVGSNNRNTTFSGIIRGGLGNSSRPSVTKVGNGRLTLSNANSYTGGTKIKGGMLLVTNSSGSGTGTGPVHVNFGTLGGTGRILGLTTIGTGTGTPALLSPGVNGPGTFIFERALVFRLNGTYNCELNSDTISADNAVAKGITIRDGAQFSLVDLGSAILPPGTIFTVITNTRWTPIDGTFSNLQDGSTLTVGSNTYQANYEGGDGNDLTLTVVP